MSSRHCAVENTLWYHVCATCHAKWFSHRSVTACPRCSRCSQSRERITPPWFGAVARSELALLESQEKHALAGD